MGNPIFQPELPARVSHLPSFTSAITALRSAMSQVLHTMTRNASGLEFPGGLILFLLYTLRGQQLWYPLEGKNSQCSSISAPHSCGYRRHVQAVWYKHPPTSFLTPHLARLKTFSYVVFLRISAPFLILWRTWRYSTLVLSTPFKEEEEKMPLSSREGLN